MTYSAFFSARSRAALLLGTLLGTASAGHRVDEPQEFSLRLRFEETIVFTGSAPCFATGSITAKGRSDLLGEVSASSEDCINPKGVFDPSVPASNSFVFANPAAPMRLVTANGDLLLMSYVGNLTAREGGPHRIRGHFIITGGTGRFLRATGGGTLSGHEDISLVLSGQGTVVARGSIVH